MGLIEKPATIHMVIVFVVYLNQMDELGSEV